MLKTFSVLKQADHTWTGGGIHTNEKYMIEIDKLINDYAKNNKLMVCKVDYSMVNENTQYGSNPNNTRRIIYLVAAVYFKKRLFPFFLLSLVL